MWLRHTLGCGRDFVVRTGRLNACPVRLVQPSRDIMASVVSVRHAVAKHPYHPIKTMSVKPVVRDAAV